MRPLTKKEKICAVGAVVCVVALGGIGIYIKVKDDTPAIVENTPNQRITNNQHERQQNEGDEENEDEGKSPKIPNPRISIKTPNPNPNPSETNSETNTEDVEEAKKFSSAIKKLLDNPDDSEAPKLMEVAKKTFTKAKKVFNKTSSDYHEALEYNKLEEYLNEKVEEERIKTKPDESALKAVKALRLLNPDALNAFSDCDTVQDLGKEIAKKNHNKEEVRKIAKKIALKVVDKGISGVLHKLIEPVVFLQLKPEELENYREEIVKTSGSINEELNSKPVREQYYFLSNLNMLRGMIDTGKQKLVDNTWRDWTEAGLKFYDSEEFGKFILSENSLIAKLHGVGAALGDNLFSNPDLIELHRTADCHLEHTIGSFVETLLRIENQKLNDGGSVNTEIFQLIVNFSKFKSKEDANNFFAKISGNAEWKKYALEALKNLKIENVSPNLYYKMLKLKLEP